MAADGPIAPPPGFTIDAPAAAPPEPPEGFKLDQAPAQMTGIKRALALPGANFLSGFLSTMAPFAGAVADPSGMGIGALTPPRPGMPSMAELGPQLPDAVKTQASQLSNIPSLTPQNALEKAVAVGSQGAGSALPYAVAGGGIVPTLGAGFGGGVGGMYGRQLGEKMNHPDIGGAAGGFLGGVVGGMGGNALNKVYNAMTANFMPLGQAYKEAGVPMIMTGDISGSPSLQTVQTAASKALGGSGRMHEGANEVLDSFRDSVEGTANTLGGSTTVQELGDKVQSAGKNWITNFKNASQASQGAVDQVVGSQTPVILSNTETLLGQIRASAAGNPEAEAFLKSPLAGSIQKIVEAAPQGPWGGAAAPWSTTRAIRTRVGEYLENPAMIADAGSAQAKRIYGALTADLRGTAQAVNPQALSMFDAANTQTAAGHQFIEDVLTPLMNKSSPQAAQSILSSLNSGSQTIGPLAQQMPAAAGEVAAFKLRDMANATVGQQNAAGTAISPPSFLTDWNKLAPEAKAALYQDPAVASKINALARVSESIKNSIKMANTSNTSAHSAALIGIPTMAVEGARQGLEMGGIPGAAIGAVTGAAALPAFGRGLSYMGANRYLAPLLAAKGATLRPAESGLLGLLSGARPQGPLQ